MVTHRPTICRIDTDIIYCKKYLLFLNIKRQSLDDACQNFMAFSRLHGSIGFRLNIGVKSDMITLASVCWWFVDFKQCRSRLSQKTWRKASKLVSLVKKWSCKGVWWRLKVIHYFTWKLENKQAVFEKKNSFNHTETKPSTRYRFVRLAKFHQLKFKVLSELSRWLQRWLQISKLSLQGKRCWLNNELVAEIGVGFRGPT